MPPNEELLGYDPKTGKLVPVACIVDHPSHGIMRIRHRKDTDIAVVQSGGGPVEVLICALGYDSYRMHVEPPKLDEQIVLRRTDEGTFLIEYVPGYRNNHVR